MRNNRDTNDHAETTAETSLAELLEAFKNSISEDTDTDDGNSDSSDNNTDSNSHFDSDSDDEISNILEFPEFYEEPDYEEPDYDTDEADEDSSNLTSPESLRISNNNSSYSVINSINFALKAQPVGELSESDFASRIYYGMKVADVIDSFFRGCEYNFATNRYNGNGFLFLSRHQVDDNHIESIVNVNYSKRRIQTTIKLEDVVIDPKKEALILKAINAINTDNVCGNVFLTPDNECFLFYSYSIDHSFSLSIFEETWFTLLETASKVSENLKRASMRKLNRSESNDAIRIINSLASSINFKSKNKNLSDSIKAIIGRKLSPAEETLIAILTSNAAS